jgi:hypothetical protein
MQRVGGRIYKCSGNRGEISGETQLTVIAMMNFRMCSLYPGVLCAKDMQGPIADL